MSKFYIFSSLMYVFSFLFFRLNDPSLSVLTARLMEQWMEKCLLCLESTSSPLVSNEWSAARDELLELTLNCMEHQNAFIRHSAKNAFESILKIHLLIHSIPYKVIVVFVNLTYETLCVYLNFYRGWTSNLKNHSEYASL